ncbi:MAG: hypothetical protein SF002_09730 [Alphaproteobacteria bacterium]|nr:hypothetical protein [Alphaproteobacteria bacterium]
MSQLALWTFNAGAPFALGTAISAAQDVVSGTPRLTPYGGATYTAAGVTGTAYNDGTTNHSDGQALSWAATGTNDTSNGYSIVMELSTVGATGIDVRLDYNSNAAGTNRLDFLYSLDGSNWVRHVNNQSITRNGTWQSLDMTGTFPTLLDNRDRVFIAIADPSASNQTSFDNIQVNGTTLANANAPRITGMPSGIATDRLDQTDVARTRGYTITLTDADTATSALTVTATSSNQAVLADSAIRVTGSGATRQVLFDATGTGVATVTLTVSDGVLSTTRTVSVAASGVAVNTSTATTHFLSGAADLSTAVTLNGQIITANDEDQIIRVYTPGASGAPVASLPLQPIDPAPRSAPLSLTNSGDGITREMDIEGSTLVGNRIWWIASHSTNSDGTSNRINRERLFATDVTGTGANTALSIVGHYSHLETDLSNWDTNNTHGLGANFFGINASRQTGVVPEAANGSGWNIEGLTLSPNNGALWVAMRAPIVPATARTQALIVPVTNYDAIINATGGTAGTAVFGTPIQLDLVGRGIRSIERAADGTYLIVAGPAGSVGASPNDFRLYLWNGQATSAPQLQMVNLSSLLNGGSIEGIVQLPSSLSSNSTVQLLLDMGDAQFYGDGTSNKERVEPDQRRSAVVTVRLDGTDLVVPATTVTNTTVAGTQIDAPVGTSVTLAPGTGQALAPSAATTGLQTAAQALLPGTADSSDARAAIAAFTSGAGTQAITVSEVSLSAITATPAVVSIAGSAGLDALVLSADRLPSGSQITTANVDMVIVGGPVSVTTTTVGAHLIGDEANQTFRLATGAETVTAGPGDDLVFPGRGNDSVEGGTGVDVVVLAAERGQTTIRQFGLFASVTSADGTDRLARVDSVQFTDGTRTVLIPSAMSELAPSSQTVIAQRGFDAAFYLARNADVLATIQLPAGDQQAQAAAMWQAARTHYAQFGWREGRDPNSLFQTSSYLSSNPDVRAAGIDPLDHYLAFGAREGRVLTDFNASAYTAANADVRLAGVNPLEHALQFGFSEGRAV